MPRVWVHGFQSSSCTVFPNIWKKVLFGQREKSDWLLLPGSFSWKFLFPLLCYTASEVWYFYYRMFLKYGNKNKMFQTELMVKVFLIKSKVWLNSLVCLFGKSSWEMWKQDEPNQAPPIITLVQSGFLMKIWLGRYLLM